MENQDNISAIQSDSISLNEAIKKAEKLKALLVEVKELLREITRTSAQEKISDDAVAINGTPLPPKKY